MSKPKVMVRMVSRGNPDARAVTNLWVNISQKMPSWDVGTHINKLAVDLTRNEVIAEAREASVDFLIMLDDDVIPNLKVLELPDHDKPVVAGMVPTWKEGRILWNAYDITDDRMVPVTRWKPGELRRVHACGGAILCLRKDVINMKYADPLFAFTTRPNGVLSMRGGEDLAFCKKMRAWNVPVYVDPDCQGEHHATIALLQTMAQVQSLGKEYSRSFDDPNGLFPTEEDYNASALEIERDSDNGSAHTNQIPGDFGASRTSDIPGPVDTGRFRQSG